MPHRLNCILLHTRLTATSQRLKRAPVCYTRLTVTSQRLKSAPVCYTRLTGTSQRLKRAPVCYTNLTGTGQHLKLGPVCYIQVTGTGQYLKRASVCYTHVPARTCRLHTRDSSHLFATHKWQLAPVFYTRRFSRCSSLQVQLMAEGQKLSLN